MKYSFRIIHGAATKSEAKVDSILKKKKRFGNLQVPKN